MICAVFLASGRATRFGGANKLLYKVGGVPMAERVFRAVPPDIPGFVVTAWDGVKALARHHENITVIDGRGCEDDVSETIRRGIQALPPETEGALFLVCDQPWLTAESVRRLIGSFREDPVRISILAGGGRSGNPCLFPRSYFPELASLPAGSGGKAVIRSHPGAARYVEAADAHELDDLDELPDNL